MKKRFVTLVICFYHIVVVFGQKLDSLTLKDLEIPNSTGFILLDKSPTTIERPNSSRAFILSAFNSFTENNGIPKNYAVDFTPFWFFKHPNMTSYKYMGYDINKDKQRIFKDFKKMSLSFAFVTTTDSAAKNQINNWSFGLRTNILSIRSPKDISDFKAANKRVVMYLKSMDEQMIAKGITPELFIRNKPEYDKKLKEFFASKEQDSTVAKNDLRNILSRKAMFAIDCALGYNSFFLDKNYSDGHFGRFGAWLTMNYSQNIFRKSNDKNYLSIYALGRYMSDGTKMENNKYILQNFYDFGGKLELEFKNLSVAYEYIYRINDKTKSYRSSGIIKYRISDQLYLTGAIGKNFGNNNNLISLLGLNWGLLSGTEQPKIVKE
jgi:hypothetical protein